MSEALLLLPLSIQFAETEKHFCRLCTSRLQFLLLIYHLSAKCKLEENSLHFLSLATYIINSLTLKTVFPS